MIIKDTVSGITIGDPEKNPLPVFKNNSFPEVQEEFNKMPVETHSLDFFNHFFVHLAPLVSHFFSVVCIVATVAGGCKFFLSVPLPPQAAGGMVGSVRPRAADRVKDLKA